MPRQKRKQLPHYQDTYPEHLATADELRQAGLKPHPPEPVAILDQKLPGGGSRQCGLHERATAVTREVKVEAS